MGTVRCPVLVGRASELALGDDALAQARAGHGAVIAFVGEAGIGKTRLTKELVGAAHRRGLGVIAGRSSLEFSGVPLRGWSEALMAAARTVAWPESASALAPYRAALGMVVPHWRDSTWSAPIEAPVVLGEAILRTLEYLAGDAGLLVVLDDLHWADQQTIESLSYVIDHIAEVPVLLCLALRDEGKGTEILAMLHRAEIAECRLGRLSPAEMQEMIQRCMPLGETLIDVESLVIDSEGLPLVIEDLLSVDTSDRRPRRFVDVVRARVSALSAAHRRAVAAAAILGEKVDWRVVVRALAMEAADGASALRGAIAEGLLTMDGDQVGFRHALTRSVIASDVLAIERTELARVLAEALTEVTPAGLDRDLLVADLLVDAGSPGSGVEVLAGAGTRAETAGELADAAVAFGRAFRLAGDHNLPGFLQLGTSLVRSHLQVGQSADAVDLGTELLARSDGTDKATTLQLHLLLARACIDRAEWSAATTQVIAARQLTDGEEVLAELAIFEAECAFGADLPGQRVAVEHQVEKAVAMAERSGVDRLLCEAYHIAGRVGRQRDLNTAAAALVIALDVAERASLSVQRLKVLDELGTVEMLRDARTDRLERAYHEALRVGAFGAAASAGLNLASAYVMTGRHERCAELASDVKATASRLGLHNLEAACEFTLGIAAAFSGDRSRSERHCAQAERLAPHDADLRAGVWAIAHGLGALVDDDRPRARRAFVTARSNSPERHARILDASLGPTMLLDAVDGRVAPAEVARAMELEVRGARWSELWLGAALASSYANSGSAVQATDALATALVAGERYPLFGAIARRIIADTACATDFTDPIELLRDAEAAFVDLGLERAAEGVRGRLRALGHAAPRQRGASTTVADDLRRVGVTKRELDVLELLGERKTNREIATQLYLSPKTVEKHVAALATKLGAANRLELAEIARRRPIA